MTSITQIQFVFGILLQKGEDKMVERMGHPNDKYRQTVQPVLKSKIEEFELFGYDTVTEEELWAYLKNKKWKRVGEEMMLYSVVNDILTLKIGDFMNYVTVEAFKSPNLLDENAKEALENLL